MADPLFSKDELSDLLQKDVTDSAAAVAERVARGWLKDATGLAEWPDPLPDELWSWAIELGGLVYTNPAALATEGEGPFSTTWERGRRDAILAAAARRYGGSGKPRGSFPAAQPWPDQATTRATGGS